MQKIIKNKKKEGVLSNALGCFDLIITFWPKNYIISLADFFEVPKKNAAPAARAIAHTM